MNAGEGEAGGVLVPEVFVLEFGREVQPFPKCSPVSAEVGGDERAAFAVEEDEIIWAALYLRPRRARRNRFVVSVRDRVVWIRCSREHDHAQ